jgi:DNA-binding GntR family transcriptional regulator
MKRLAEELNDSRLEISRALNNMQAEGLILLRRGVIFIPAMEKLIM